METCDIKVKKGDVFNVGGIVYPSENIDKSKIYYKGLLCTYRQKRYMITDVQEETLTIVPYE